MEHRISRPMTEGATWERRTEALKAALSGDRTDMGYALITATMAYFEAVDSNDYERAEAFRGLREALAREDAAGAADAIAGLEEIDGRA